jgi:adenosylmethionine-8-amino-7-oxononanoate aminotransferase
MIVEAHGNAVWASDKKNIFDNFSSWICAAKWARF